jgi:hypothetical protein
MEKRAHSRSVLPFCLVLILSLALIFPGTAAASSSAPAEPPEVLEAGSLHQITPMFLYVSRTATSLLISPTGLATATGSLVGYPGITDEVWIFLYLQVFSNGTWQTLQTWSQIYQGYYGVLQATAYVSSGHYYRVKASYYAWSGNSYEQFTSYSSNVYY